MFTDSYIKSAECAVHHDASSYVPYYIPCTSKVIIFVFACIHTALSIFQPFELVMTKTQESGMREETWDGLAQGVGQRIVLSPLEVLHDCDEAVHAFYVLLEGSMVAERTCGDKDGVGSASVAAGSLLSCAAFLSATRSRCSFAAGLETCVLAAFGNQELLSLINAEGERGYRNKRKLGVTFV